MIPSRLSITIALACGMMLCAGPTLAFPVGPDITVDSEILRLTFGVSESRLRLSHISALGGREWLADFEPGMSLWRIGFSGPEGVHIDVASADVGLSAVKQSAKECVFTWSAPLTSAQALVTMTVKSGGDGLSSWSLEVILPDDWKVVRCDFPLIPNIAPAKGLRMAAPMGWGVEYRAEPGMHYHGTYPSCRAVMQFLAFYHRGKGLYIGAHDPRGHHKYFEAKATEAGISYLCANWPSIAPRGGGKYSPPFEAVIGVFDGGYYDAAQIYRRFTFDTVWGKAGSVSERHIPRWLKDTDLWLLSERTVDENLKMHEKACAFFGIPIGFHWYRWHQIPHDVMYPEYFPAHEGFAEGARTVQESGWRVMPYINGRLADPQSDFWKEQGGDRAAVRHESGEVCAETYVPDVPLNVMCPTTDLWQQTVAGLAERLFREFGVDGVYVDQISAAGPVRCFDPAHEHLPGGGAMWVDGYRTMLEQVRRRIPTDAILATEENAECWIDQFDLQLMANTPNNEGDALIPLFPAVYSGRSLLYGFQYPAWDDLVKSVPFRAKMARSFLWGAQPGWVRLTDITREEAVKEAEFLRNLALCRRFGHEFLVYGRFLGMVPVRGDNPRVKCPDAYGSFGGTYVIDLPSVMASAWLSQNGELGLALSNMSDESRAVTLDLPLVQARMSASRGLDVQLFGPEGRISAALGKSATQSVTVPGRGALILKVRQL